MTNADPQHVRAGGAGRVWRGFQSWRRTRPFWGGLLTALAGVEMFASTKMTLNGLSFHSGSTGLYSLLIPVILVSCGLLLWFSPGQRLFYSIVAVVTTIYSLMGLNLGGFFLGLLLGIIGSALAFAWTPTARPATDPTAGPTDGEPAAEVPPDGPPESPGTSRDPQYFAVALVVLGLSATALVAIHPQPVRAAAPATTPTTCPKPPARATTPSPSPSRVTPTPTASPSSSASPSPSAEPSSDGNILTDILDGIGDLFTGGKRAASTAPSASPSPAAGAVGTPGAPAAATPTPTGSGGATPTCPPAKPSTPRKVEAGAPMPKIAPEPGQPKVAQQPSKLTGSKVTMTGLRFEGIVELPTQEGTLKCLKFTMDKAVTEDFTLRATGPDGKAQRYVTDRLTVEGDVAFYATRFVGHLLGIKITLTPDLPFPDGIPITSPIPISFTDPVIDLAYENSKSLTARPVLKLDLA
ncbi:hypothetical protein GCM10010169_55850 [Micromonospora fulviviridis]|uniref:DUF6114 domain-containing protein n=1 Tax=Micromonospora fulviviridis TaxID=47860 RepID=UPI001663DA2C|nr:DUF6114 domain-containing protein [Micromonospora fulviviridis]GGS03878.1 hypothetical protein GCM10010169_55850 [Micromonospora fulviviridis]